MELNVPVLVANYRRAVTRYKQLGGRELKS